MLRDESGLGLGLKAVGRVSVSPVISQHVHGVLGHVSEAELGGLGRGEHQGGGRAGTDTDTAHLQCSSEVSQ